MPLNYPFYLRCQVHSIIFLLHGKIFYVYHLILFVISIEKSFVKFKTIKLCAKSNIIFCFEFFLFSKIQNITECFDNANF